MSSPLRPSSNGDDCRRSLAHCQSDYTKSRNIQVSSSLARSQFRCTVLRTVSELKNVAREAKLLYTGDNSFMNTVRIHTCYSNTDMFLKRHANTTVGFSPKRKLSSKPLIFFTAIRLHLFRLGAAGELFVC